MVEGVTGRETRCFDFYKGNRLVLTIEDRPGTLLSTAPPSPAPTEPVSHPYLDARAYDAASEHNLRRLLMESACFDDYVAALIRAGYDAVSDNPPRLQTLGAGFRIADKHGLAGVVWQGRGQFASLRWQPPEGMLVFDHATLTVYREDCIRLLCDQTEATGTFEELQRALTAHGFHLVPVMR